MLKHSEITHNLECQNLQLLVSVHLPTGYHDFQSSFTARQHSLLCRALY